MEKFLKKVKDQKEKIYLIFFLLIQFNSISQKLSTYESFSHFDVDKYLQQYSRELDREGIVIQKKEYHALTISIYGIMNYDAFIETGDSCYYTQTINQFKYFKDPSKLVFMDYGRSAGLPYNFNFKGMIAPWFSGMTQGTAVSFLLRYYKLTSDKFALELCEKLIHLMLKKEADGGTIGRTKEGGMWIEEYPNAIGSKSVLNGFINGLIGLHEYCVFFPNDKNAKAIHDSCYTEMIENLDKYDNPNTTTYSRSVGSISNSYLRYELEEFDHLYSLYKDERLRDQMKIWSRFAVNKFDNELQFLKQPKYQFATVLLNDPIKGICKFDNYSLFSLGLVNAISLDTNGKVMRYQLETASYYCEIEIPNSRIEPGKIKIETKYQGNKIKPNISYSKNRIIIQSSQPMNEIKIILPKKRAYKNILLSVKSYDYRTCELPMFGIYSNNKKYALGKNEKYLFQSEKKNLTNAKVFYRYTPFCGNPETVKFTIYQSFNLSEGSFSAPAEGEYHFFICYDLTHPFSSLGGLKLVALSDLKEIYSE